MRKSPHLFNGLFHTEYRTAIRATSLSLERENEEVEEGSFAQRVRYLRQPDAKQ